MATYAASNVMGGTQQALTTSYKTLTALTAATATLTTARIFDVIVGCDGTPADHVVDFDVSRQTAAGTSTAITPAALDGAVRAAGTVGSANFTAEGTITSNTNVFNAPVNVRATQRWVAVPGDELVIPATNLAGFAARAKSPSGYTGTARAEMWFRE